MLLLSIPFVTVCKTALTSDDLGRSCSIHHQHAARQCPQYFIVVSRPPSMSSTCGSHTRIPYLLSLSLSLSLALSVCLRLSMIVVIIAVLVWTLRHVFLLLLSYILDHFTYRHTRGRKCKFTQASWSRYRWLRVCSTLSSHRKHPLVFS